MTLRTIITIILIGISIPLMIIWKYWEGQMYNVNFWVSGYDFPLNVQWFVLFLSTHGRDLLISYAIYRMSHKIRAVRIMAIVNLVYSVVDTGLFFWSFNRGEDVLLVHYTVTGVVSLLIIMWPKVKQAIKNSRNHHNINYS